jgi:hypothetical protein
MRLNRLSILLLVLILAGLCGEVSAQTRIRFARGRTSASLSGTIGGGGVRTFVLGARRGQYLSANVSSRGDCIKFSEGATSTNFTTESGDNILSITNYCGRSTSFVLTVSINYGSD